MKFKLNINNLEITIAPMGINSKETGKVRIIQKKIIVQFTYKTYAGVTFSGRRQTLLRGSPSAVNCPITFFGFWDTLNN